MNLSHFFALNKGSHTIDGTLGIINVSNCAGNRSATGGGEFEVFVIELAALALADRMHLRIYSPLARAYYKRC